MGMLQGSVLSHLLYSIMIVGDEEGGVKPSAPSR